MKREWSVIIGFEHRTAHRCPPSPTRFNARSTASGRSSHRHSKPSCRTIMDFIELFAVTEVFATQEKEVSAAVFGREAGSRRGMRRCKRAIARLQRRMPRRDPASLPNTAAETSFSCVANTSVTANNSIKSIIVRQDGFEWRWLERPDAVDRALNLVGDGGQRCAVRCSKPIMTDHSLFIGV